MTVVHPEQARLVRDGQAHPVGQRRESVAAPVTGYAHQPAGGEAGQQAAQRPGPPLPEAVGRGTAAAGRDAGVADQQHRGVDGDGTGQGVEDGDVALVGQRPAGHGHRQPDGIVDLGRGGELAGPAGHGPEPHDLRPGG